MKNLLITQLLLVSLTLISCNNQTSNQDQNFHIYLCFGQSNMEGIGVIEPQDLEVPENFLTLQAVDCPESNKMIGNWYTAIPPLSQCDAGLGPTDYFGRTMLENLPEDHKLGIINVAVGGCDIRLFDQDIYQNYTDTYPQDWFVNKLAAYNGHPYERLVELAKQAQEEGVIKGILLHQGETNTGDEEWPNYVNKIYQDLLNDLSLNAKEVPLLAGEVVSVEPNCCAKMNNTINTLPDVIETAHVISSENCTTMDEAHFDSEGYRELGRRYATKMLTLLKN